MERKSYWYQQYTWQELKALVPRQPVVVQPIGSVEDHGHHLPLDTDNFLIQTICEEAARRADGEILLLPPIPYGFETHHMDFPGTIDIRMEHLLNFVLDVTKSVAHHGFKRILIADGHGSNMPILELVARRTILETDSLCGAFIWPSLAAREIQEVRESELGGMAHAGELETSVYLHLDAHRVQMDKAVKEIGLPPSNFIFLDLMASSPVLFMDIWTRFSKTGVVGDPKLATAEKGRVIFEAVVEAFLRLVRPDGEVSTFAGTGQQRKNEDSGGDGGPATEARLSYPAGLVVGQQNEVYIADSFLVRKVHSNGIITSVFDDGPWDDYLRQIEFDPSSGRLYIAQQNNRIWRVEHGRVSHYAGSREVGCLGDGGPPTKAQFNYLIAGRRSQRSWAMDGSGTVLSGMERTLFGRASGVRTDWRSTPRAGCTL